MKRILLLLFVVLFICDCIAQREVTEFMGIPVDGPIHEMKANLLKKGFVPAETLGNNIMTGEFNGRNVMLSIYGHKGQTYSVNVMIHVSGVENAKVLANLFYMQLSQSCKYLSAKGIKDSFIADDEGGDRNIFLNAKAYYETFYQVFTDSDDLSMFKGFVIKELGVDRPELLLPREREEALKLFMEFQEVCAKMKVVTGICGNDTTKVHTNEEINAVTKALNEFNKTYRHPACDRLVSLQLMHLMDNIYSVSLIYFNPWNFSPGEDL